MRHGPCSARPAGTVDAHTFAALAEVAVLQGDPQRAAGLLADARERYAAARSGVAAVDSASPTCKAAANERKEAASTPSRTPDEKEEDMSQTIAPVLGEATVQELREAVRGAVLAPADDGYEDACPVWNGMIRRRAAGAHRPLPGNADVIAAIGFARSERPPVAVRGGGHSIAGFSTATAASSSTSRR